MISAVGNLEMSQGTVSVEFRTQTNVFPNHSFNILGLKIHRNPQFDPFLDLRGVVLGMIGSRKIEFHKKTSFLESTQYRLSNKQKLN